MRAVRFAIGLVTVTGFGVLVACGAAAHKSASPPSAVDASPAGMSPLRAELDELDRRIAADLAQLGLAAPTVEAGTAPVPAANIALPTADPTCKPSPSDTCKAQCTLGDSICTNAKRICEIAAELGDDSYANGKCTSGKASCDAARERCCGCL